MKDVKKFSIDIINDIPDNEDLEFSIVRINGLSCGYNSHEMEISEEILRRDAQSVLGKPIVVKLEKNWIGKLDATDHNKGEIVVGYVPKDAEIRFVESDNGIFWQVDGVIFKLYSNGMIDVFRRDGKKYVSAEFTCTYEDEEESIIKSYNICGITILGSGINPSCIGADAEIIKFSEKKAEEFYHKNSSIIELRKFAEISKEGKTYKVNKTELKTTPWSEIDKTKLRNTIMKAKNKAKLVKDVYALVEEDWEDKPSKSLKYPIMQLIDDTFYYNENGLSSALGYAKAENETEVISKVEKIYKSLNINSEEESNKMVENKDSKIKEDKNETPKEEIAEKDKLKNEKLSDDDDDETGDNDEEEPEDEKKEKLSSDANVDSSAYAEMLEIEAKKNEVLAKQLEDKDNVIMKYETELSSLRKFKDDTEEELKMAEVTSMLSKAKGKMEESEYAKCEKEGKECKFSKIDAWKNMVFAKIGQTTLKFSSNESKETHMRMNLFQDESKDNESLWN
ncbi:MAG: hypothetical protein RR255_00245 [Bacilli bacterium]